MRNSHFAVFPIPQSMHCGGKERCKEIIFTGSITRQIERLNTLRVKQLLDTPPLNKNGELALRRVPDGDRMAAEAGFSCESAATSVTSWA
jgi:hypothetical protein